MQAGILESGIADRKRHDMNQLPHSSGFATRTDILLATPGERPGPQAFLVEQSEDSVAASHFHAEPQFQVVVAGGGMLGRHELKPYAVHYANRYTGYGPIEAGSQGISYVTLRAHGDMQKPFYLPEAKNLMKPGVRLNLTSDTIARDIPAASAGGQCEVAIAPRPDGIGAWVLRLAANQTMPAPVHANNGGQFWLVVEGGMRTGSQLLPRLSCAFASGDESGGQISAGPAGLVLIVLQYAAEQ
jgi:hypothetical protein